MHAFVSRRYVSRRKTSAAMFSVVDAVLLRPLPYHNPDQLAILWTGIPGQTNQGRTAYFRVEEWRVCSHSFADIAIYDPVSATLTNATGAERIGVARVSPNFFSLLELTLSGPLCG